MKKRLFNIIILLVVITAAIIIWKPNIFSKNHTKEKTIAADSLPNKEIPGIKLSSLERGTKAPDFELTTLSGKKTKLSDFRGKIVILNFWATWCPPCKAEMPNMENFYKKHRNKEITIVSVNLTNMEKGIDAVQAFVKDYGLSFNILLDEQGIVDKTYQAFTIPTSYIIDKNGVISNKVIGPMDEDMMKNLTGIN